jgi:hypothetical protein
LCDEIAPLWVQSSFLFAGNDWNRFTDLAYGVQSNKTAVMTLISYKNGRNLSKKYRLFTLLVVMQGAGVDYDPQ